MEQSGTLRPAFSFKGGGGGGGKGQTIGEFYIVDSLLPMCNNV